MKKGVFLFIALFVAFTPCRADEPSPLRFPETMWMFGKILEDDGPVSHVFEFTNGGKTPVAIDRATASCGCTTPEYPKRPLAVGEKSSITVTFDPKGYPGEFRKEIRVVSGGGKYVDRLFITGEVIPHIKSIEEQFPHDMGGGVRFDNTFFAFGNMAQGRTHTVMLNYVNTSSKPVSLSIVPIEESGLLTVDAPEAVLPAGWQGAIILTYNLAASSTPVYGARHDVLEVSVDGVTARKTVYTAMTGIDDFSATKDEAGTAPRFFLEAQSHDFGEVRRRAMPYVFRQTASNEGGRVLHIRSVSQAEGLRCTLREGMTIAPGAELPFEILLYTDEYYKGDLRRSITVVVDDPLRPVREIRISAKIK